MDSSTTRKLRPHLPIVVGVCLVGVAVSVSCGQGTASSSQAGELFTFSSIKTQEEFIARQKKCHNISSKTNCRYFTIGCKWVDSP
ncbi:MAG: hypothetical protein AAF320_05955, partial [Myxococcota bacterium]